jgi:hypothetical protein
MRHLCSVLITVCVVFGGCRSHVNHVSSLRWTVISDEGDVMFVGCDDLHRRVRGVVVREGYYIVCDVGVNPAGDVYKIISFVTSV